MYNKLVFGVYNLISFDMSIDPWNYHNQGKRYFYHPQEFLHFPPPHSSSNQQSLGCCPYRIVYIFLEFYRTGNIQYTVLCLALFTELIIWNSSMPLCISLMSGIPLYGCNTTCLSTYWWTFGWFLIFLLQTKMLWRFHLCVDTCFHFCWVNNTEEWNGWMYYRHMFSFLRNYKIVFQNGCTILYSYQQCRRHSVALHPHQNLDINTLLNFLLSGRHLPLSYYHV